MNRKVIGFFFAALFSVCALFATEYRDGVYTKTVTETGLGSLTVRVTVRDGLLALIEFPAGTQDLYFEDGQLEQFVRSLIASPSFMEVDAVSGATSSCDLIKTAVFEALKEARP